MPIREIKTIKYVLITDCPCKQETPECDTRNDAHDYATSLGVVLHRYKYLCQDCYEKTLSKETP